MAREACTGDAVHRDIIIYTFDENGLQLRYDNYGFKAP